MKKKLLVFSLFLTNFLFSYSQEEKIYWNSLPLSLSDITNNSFVIKNNSASTIKVKFFSKRKEINQGILESGSFTRIIYPDIEVFSKVFFDDYSIRVYYDFDCFVSDMKMINAVAAHRIENAKYRHYLKALARGVAEWLENLGNSDWQKVGYVTNRVLDGIELTDAIQEDGWETAIENKIKDTMKGDPLGDAIDETIKNRYVKSAINSIKIFYDYSKEPISVDLTDLNKYTNRIFALASQYTSNPISTYRIDYEKMIRPVIDRDFDGIPNIYDECPDKRGDLEFMNDPKYKGCTKADVKEKKRLARKIAIAKIIGYYGSYEFKSRWGNSSLGFGYKYLEFLDANYMMRLKEKILKYSYGFTTNISLTYYPITIDLSAFYSKFTMDDFYFDSFNDYPDKRIYHYGLSGYLTVFPLPRLGGLTDYIMPYAGVGVETSSLCISKQSFWSAENTGGKTNTLASIPTSELKWKIGTKIYLGRKYSLYGEYYHPIVLDEVTANKGWIMGISIKI